MGEGWSWQIVWGFFKTTLGDRWWQCVSFIISDPLFNQRQRKTATVQRTGLQDKVSFHHHSSPPLLTHTHTHIFSNTRLYPSKRPHTHWWDVRVLTPDWICPLTPQDPKKGRHPCRCHGNTVLASRVSWTMMLVMSSTQWEEHPTSFPIIISCLFPSAFNAIPIALIPTIFKKNKETQLSSSALL